MVNSPRRSRKWIDDKFLRWYTALIIVALAVQAIVYFFGDPNQPVVIVPAYQIARAAFFVLGLVNIAFLAFGRYQVMRDPASFWLGTTGVFSLVFIIFAFINVSTLFSSDFFLWLSFITQSILVTTVLLMAFAHWPRAEVFNNHWWISVVIDGVIAITVILAILAFVQFLSPLIIVNVPILPAQVFFSTLNALNIVATVALAYRFYQTNDLIFASASVLAYGNGFGALVPSGVVFSLSWFLSTGIALISYTVSVIILLASFVRLYRIEQDRTHEMRVLIDTTPVGIVVYKAPEGFIALFNQSAENIFGKPIIPELSLRDAPSYFQIYRPSGQIFSLEELPIIQALHGETIIGVEAIIHRPSGQTRDVLISASPLRDFHDQVVGVVSAYQDITPIREQEHLRDEFLSAAAHELKTPITTIKGYVQLIHNWPLHEREQREDRALEVINKQIDRINSRVQEMLEAVRLRTAMPEIQRVRFDLGDLVYQVVEKIQAAARSQRLDFKREGAVVIEADREHIEEVVESLIDNAIRLSSEGQDIEVRVWAQKKIATVSIRDQGVGIPKERQPHIFEPFYEPIPAGAYGYRGIVALSLYLSKLTIEQHGGKIWFESEEGKGSTFYFSLPLEEGHINKLKLMKHQG